MSDILRWRYGDTSPVVIPVDSATVIEIGDLVYLDTEDAKPASSLAARTPSAMLGPYANGACPRAIVPGTGGRRVAPSSKLGLD